MGIENEVSEVKLTEIKISPQNVRHDFKASDDHVKELAESIKDYGQLQPVVLMGSHPPYQLIVGQRRYHAVKSLKHTTIKAVFLKDKLTGVDATVVSLSENLHRVNLTTEDMITAITKIYDYYKSAKKVAQIIGTSIPTVYEYLKIERFVSPKVKKLLAAKKISKEDIKRAIVIGKGDQKDVEDTLEELVDMTGFQKNRAINERREKPKESSKEIIKNSRISSIKSILTLNLSSEMEKGLSIAMKELKEEKETIAINALRIWLKENKFMK